MRIEKITQKIITHEMIEETALMSSLEVSFNEPLWALKTHSRQDPYFCSDREINSKKEKTSSHNSQHTYYNITVTIIVR